MTRPAERLFLRPGDLYFGSGVRVQTILGSCVALVLWHPERRVGGMCHFVLPTRGERCSGAPDHRYGDEAVATLVERMQRVGTRPEEYRSRLFGGGNMFPSFNTLTGSRVGDQNIAMARALVQHYRLRVVEEDVGGDVYRTLWLDLRDGSLVVHRNAVTNTKE